ncbi:MAG: MYG1 family protein [Candidatus Paceibacterota bacterium]
MEKNNESVKKLVTHNGSFHADDVFACATLSLILEARGEEFEIIRTRDEAVIDVGDYVFDVGLIYDPEKNRFDHHQPGGAGKRENGIEYAAFGLVWKKFGAELCSENDVAELIEEKLVSPIDAGDNAISLVEFTGPVKPYFIQSAFNAFYPSWKNLTMENLYSGFIECVNIAKMILKKEINQAQDISEAIDAVVGIYNETSDKQIIILDKKYPYENIMQSFPEPLFVIYPRADGYWAVKAERKDFSKNFENKKDFPVSWAGLRDEELQKESGVEDAMFCHRALFMAVAKSKEGAVKLARIAVES